MSGKWPAYCGYLEEAFRTANPDHPAYDQETPQEHQARIDWFDQHPEVFEDASKVVYR